MSSRNNRRRRLASIGVSLRNSFNQECLPEIAPNNRKSIEREKPRNKTKLSMKRRRSIIDLTKKESINCTQSFFSPKPKKLAFFNKKITFIPNFWNKKKARKMTLQTTTKKTKAKILVCKKETESEKREKIKLIFDSMDAKYSKYIKHEIQRKHKLVL
ncbi:unnamed protein product [Moneuplotes crassus]|uniref:Uncharacterized protein n=1 Tax=Euplotes crassus TaxID=5936 RepID=A0AAD2D6U8_EUPCR|nr:unnamed protein product [Moneuplotes crassus]